MNLTKLKFKIFNSTDSLVFFHDLLLNSALQVAMILNIYKN